jgi:hypothetical protein
MTGRKQHQSKKARTNKRAKRSLAGTRLFAPLLGLWGGLLGALPVLVVPGPTFANAMAGLRLSGHGLPLQPLLAAIAALMLGVGTYALAAAMHRRAVRREDGKPLAARALREVWPIDPARDLGSQSIDDPITTMPFATPAWRDGEVSEPAPQPEPEPVAETVAETAPRALDLSEFAELPGRNAVWVEEAPEFGFEPEAEPVPAEPVAYAPVAELRQPETAPAPAPVPEPEPGTAALARLRSVPPGELSLPQMVERFAVALHQHRTSPAARALTAAEIAAREAALAEALRALAALSGGRPGEAAASPADDPLRAALSQLQTRRGAA